LAAANLSLKHVAGRTLAHFQVMKKKIPSQPPNTAPPEVMFEEPRL
jgi:hypothetical protein